MFVNFSMLRILISILLITNLLSNDIDNNPNLESRIRLFEEWMNTQMDYLSLNGVSVGIVHNQELVYYKGFGFADEDNQIMADEHTNYRIASITKIFTSIALMKLVEEGAIKLNDPVTKYIPELYNIQTNGYDVEKITIKSIMRHTTGLPRNTIFFWDNEKKQKPISIDEALKGLKKQRIIYKPNRIYKYSNLAILLGGEVIKRVSKIDYNDYIKNNIFIPIGMSHRSVYVDNKIIDNLAVGYGRLIDGHRNQHEWTSMIRPTSFASGGIVSNVADLSKFVMWHFRLLNNKENYIISYKTLKKMQKVHWVGIPFKTHPIIMSPIAFLSNTFINVGNGLGDFNSFQFVGHNGANPGYATQLLMDNNNNIGIIVLANSDDAPVYSFQDRSISKNLYNIVGKALLNDKDSNDYRWSEYENVYFEAEEFLSGYFITSIDDNLALVDLSDPDPLEYPILLKELGSDSFKLPMSSWYLPGEIIHFERDNENKIVSLNLVNSRLYLKDQNNNNP